MVLSLIVQHKCRACECWQLTTAQGQQLILSFKSISNLDRLLRRVNIFLFLPGTPYCGRIPYDLCMVTRCAMIFPRLASQWTSKTSNADEQQFLAVVQNAIIGIHQSISSIVEWELLLPRTSVSALLPTSEMAMVPVPLFSVLLCTFDCRDLIQKDVRPLSPDCVVLTPVVVPSPRVLPISLGEKRRWEMSAV